MDCEIKSGAFVVCNGDGGRVSKNGKREQHITHFETNSVGQVLEVHDNDYSIVYIIGQDADYLLLNKELQPFNPLKTGKGYQKKICNICHVLKPIDCFARNQTDAKGDITRRPSCVLCREGIDQRAMTPKEKSNAMRMKPNKGEIWQCPICRKRCIVGVTAKVVLDHRHADGIARAFLCDSCNTGLGRFKNGISYLKNALAYIRQFEK